MQVQASVFTNFARMNGILALLVKCYQRSFGYDQAWNEGLICHSCTDKQGYPVKFNFSEGRTSCDDGHALSPFWPDHVVTEEMQTNLQHPNSVVVVCHDDDRVFGGAVSYILTGSQLEHELKLPGLANQLEINYPHEQRFFYLAEMFCDPDHRGTGIGSRLFRERHTHMSHTRGAGTCVFRTKRGQEKNPSKTYVWYTSHYQFKVVGEYNDPDDRVILAQTLNEINLRLMPKES